MRRARTPLPDSPRSPGRRRILPALVALAGLLGLASGCGGDDPLAGERPSFEGVEDLRAVPPLALVADARDRVADRAEADAELRLARINVLSVSREGTVDLLAGEERGQVQIVLDAGESSWAVHFIALPGEAGPLVEVAPATAPSTAAFPPEVAAELVPSARLVARFLEDAPDAAFANTALTYYLDGNDEARAVVMAGREVRSYDATTGEPVASAD